MAVGEKATPPPVAEFHKNHCGTEFCRRTSRLRFAVDASQVPRVVVGVLDAHPEWETFYTRMDKSGRITLPKLTLNLIQAVLSEQNLNGHVLEVNIEPP